MTKRKIHRRSRNELVINANFNVKMIGVVACELSEKRQFVGFSVNLKKKTTISHSMTFQTIVPLLKSANDCLICVSEQKKYDKFFKFLVYLLIFRIQTNHSKVPTNYNSLPQSAH